MPESNGCDLDPQWENEGGATSNAELQQKRELETPPTIPGMSIDPAVAGPCATKCTPQG